MGFDGGQGDDIFYGAKSSFSKTPKINDSYAIYSGSVEEYTITPNTIWSTLNFVTVKHKILTKRVARELILFITSIKPLVLISF